MTNPDDPAFAHEGSALMVQKDALELFPDAEMKLAAIMTRYQGLSKREYFAAMAMQGLALEHENRNAHWEADLAYNSIRMADALISELNKEPKP